MELKRIAVIGAGTMGRGIAQILAQANREVLLYDADPRTCEQGLARIADRLRQQTAKGRLAPIASQAAIAALRGIDQLATVSAADMVVEAVPERLALKCAVFAQLGQFAGAEAILASNTSGLDLDALAAAAGRPAKVIGMHFFNPPPTMPLVEIVRATATSDETVAAVTALAQDLGKTPVAVANSPGFAVNRILFPMINEAIYALAEGVASAEDIDRVMVLGASHPLGPLALADYVGLDVTLDILESLAQRLDPAKYRPCPLLRELVAQGALGRKTGRGFFSYPR